MQGKEFSMNYFNLGIAVGFFTVTLLVLFRNRLSKDKQDCYDERQVIVRGKGYQYAFFTTMGLLMLYAAFAKDYYEQEFSESLLRKLYEEGGLSDKELEELIYGASSPSSQNSSSNVFPST